MNNNKKIFVAAIALIDWQGKVLLTSRSRSKIYSDCWEFPGGKIKKNENADDAIIRELKEELDLDVLKQSLKPLTFTFYNYKEFEAVIFFYVCRLWKGNAVSKEGQKLLWVKLSQINSYKMLPANKKLVVSLINYSK